MLSAVHTLTPASSSSWTCCQRFGCRLSGALVWASFVDDNQFGFALERRVQIKFIERAAVVFNLAPWQDFEPLDERARLGAAISLDEPDDDIDAFVLQAPRVLQHGVGLARGRRGAEKNLNGPQSPGGTPPEARPDQGVRRQFGWFGPSALVGRHDDFNRSRAKFSRKITNRGLLQSERRPVLKQEVLGDRTQGEGGPRRSGQRR